MSNCPKCGDSFNDERSMKIHHSIVHNESIAKENSNCEACGSPFSYYPSSKPGKYCSDCVEKGLSRDINHIDEENKHKFKSGKENINYKGGKEIECHLCEELSWFSPAHIKEKENYFCSDSCYREWQSDNYQGEGNPNWKGGYNPNYSDGWWSARREALQRDNKECQLCSSKESFDGRNCDVHHKKPVREFDNPSEAHFLDNLITLCRSCHIDVENNNRKI